MRPCPKCGYNNKEEALACNLCGEPLHRAAAARPGPAPDAIYPPGFQPPVFDPSAGARQSAPSAPRPGIMESFGAHEAGQERQARLWMLGAAALLGAAFLLFLFSRLPYSAGRVDAMYEDYRARASSNAFPREVLQPFEGHTLKRNQLFQMAHAYEALFLEGQDPLEKLEAEFAERRRIIEAGGMDPGRAGQEENAATLDQIEDVEAIASGIYPTGSKPFDTLRAVAGAGPAARPADVRALESELVSGYKESQLRHLDLEEISRRDWLLNAQRGVREELDYAKTRGSPKIRSVARRLEERLFGAAE